MKMITGDIVIAKPVVLFIGPLPVIAIPYYIFPIKKGRHSGFLTLEISNIEKGDRFIRNIGYYWAASDYWDLQSSLDYEENYSVKLNSVVNYALRYRLRGRLSGSYTRRTSWSDYQRNLNLGWGLNFSHNQTLSETMSLKAAGAFQSSKDYNIDNSYDQEERLNRSVRANGSFSKRWKNESITIALDQTWNIDGEDVLDWEKYKTLNSSLVFSSPQKLLGILTINPSATINQTFYKIDKIHSVEQDSAEVDTSEYFRREVWSAAISAKTDLYGTIYPNVMNLTGLRHVVTPSASFNYAPETEYNKDYYDYTGVGTSSSKKKNIRFGLGNLFQVKYRSGEEEKKLDFVRMSTSMNYDFEKDENRWSSISNSLNSNALKIVKLTFGSSHSLYNEFSNKFQPLNPRLERLSATISFSRKFYFFASRPADEDIESGYDEIFDEVGIPGSTKPNHSKSEETTLQVNLTHRLNESYSNGKRTSQTRWLNAEFDLNLTSGWQIRFDCQYDLQTSQTTYPRFELSRDLHCWRGEFTWRPTGPLEGYYFRIYLLQLPDIKIEQSKGGVKGKSFN